ncbi:uncharacterized protein LOC142357281, partial [Convolutriloba macropyga]|uniref:uncharacterized protein LOC142357281 n=1 Tax=Convolutriloba macropyga TaxID=536237 RepID=UPI003F51C6A0
VGATVPSRAGEGQPDDGVAGVVREGLGALEQRADEVVTMWNAFQASRSHGSAFHPSASGHIQQAAPVPTRPPGSGKLQIVAPTISGGSEAGSSDDSSDEDMPMTREQLKTKVLNKTGIAYEEFVSGLAKGANKPAGRQRPVSAAVSKRSSAAAASGHVPRRPVSARPRASPASASSKSSASGERVAVTSRATGTLSGTSSRASSAVGSRKKPPTSNWR